MRFEVPQFIEIEDKIFGPLTWRQFVYVAGGGGIAASLFFMAPFFVFVLLGVPIGILAFLLGFMPVNNRPFAHFFESWVRYVTGNKLYLWRRQAEDVHRNDITITAPTRHRTPEAGSNLHNLSRNLELNAIQK